MQVDLHIREPGINRWTFLKFEAKAVNNGILHFQRSEHRIFEKIGKNGMMDRESLALIHVLFPRNVLCLVIQVVGSTKLKRSKRTQNPERRA